MEKKIGKDTNTHAHTTNRVGTSNFGAKQIPTFVRPTIEIPVQLKHKYLRMTLPISPDEMDRKHGLIGS